MLKSILLILVASTYSGALSPKKDPIKIKAVQAEYNSARSMLKLECSLGIPKPWHVNSDSLPQDYLIETKFKLSDSTQGRLVKKEYPKPVTRNLFGEKMILFEGDIEFKNFFYLEPGTAFPLKTVLQYQSCSDSICLPPKFTEILIEKTGESEFQARF